MNEQMAQPIGPQMDEDELNAELAEMESELMDSQLLAAPDVPVTNIRHQPATVVEPTPAPITAAAAAASPVAATSVPAAAAPQRQVVMAGGGGAASSAASNAGSAKKQLSEKEQREMKELEALMGM